MATNNNNEPGKKINFSVNPDKTPSFYADSYLIGSNEHVVTFNFAQATPNPEQQNIVSRIVMTKEQTKQFLASLDDHVQKFEL